MTSIDIGIRDSWKRALESVEVAGGRPYAIPAGASDHPLGGLGFANWAVELAQQEAERELFFDHVIQPGHGLALINRVGHRHDHLR